MKLSTTTPVPMESLLQEFCVSWAGLSSPLRALPQHSTIGYRHTSLTHIWRNSQDED